MYQLQKSHKTGTLYKIKHGKDNSDKMHLCRDVDELAIFAIK